VIQLPFQLSRLGREKKKRTKEGIDGCCKPHDIRAGPCIPHGKPPELVEDHPIRRIKRHWHGFGLTI
jgi:hypothetical protein